MRINNNEEGVIGVLGILLIVIVAAGVGFAGSRIYSANSSNNTDAVTQETNKTAEINSNDTSETAKPVATYTHSTLGYSVEIPEDWSYALVPAVSAASISGDTLEIRSPDYKPAASDGVPSYQTTEAGSIFTIETWKSTDSLSGTIDFMTDTGQIGVLGPTTDGVVGGEESSTYYWASEGEPSVQTIFIRNGIQYVIQYNTALDRSGTGKINPELKASFDRDMTVYKDFIASVSFE